MRYLLAIAVVLAAALAMFLSLGKAGDAENTAILKTATGSYTFNIEIADDDAERAKGLMNRDYLAPDAGMLFDFFEERPVSFWMKNTYIPLDMIFISADGTVKTIRANAFPLDLTSIPSGVPVRFVLEIPGGRAKEIGLQTGDKLSHPRIAAE